MDKFYVKFEKGVQSKNRAEKEADEYAMQCDGMLINSKYTRDVFSSKIKQKIEAINEANPRCRDIRVSETEFFGGTTSISFAGGICYLKVYPVKFEI